MNTGDYAFRGASDKIQNVNLGRVGLRRARKSATLTRMHIPKRTIAKAAQDREARDRKAKERHDYFVALAKKSGEVRKKTGEMRKALETAALDPRPEIHGPAQRALIAARLGAALVQEKPVFDARTVELAGRQKPVDAFTRGPDTQVGVLVQLNEGQINQLAQLDDSPAEPATPSANPKQD